MKTGKTIICAAVAFCSAFWLGDEVRAQGDQSGEKVEPKWEVGTDLLNPFRKSGVNPLTSTYGIIVRKRQGKAGAFRFRTNVAASYPINSDIKSLKAHSNTFSLDIGYEKRRQYGQLQHYFGVDLSQRYLKSTSAVGFGLSGPGVDPLNIRYTKFYDNRQLYGLGFFNGFKYRLAERISLSVESTVNIYHIIYQDTSQEIDGSGTAVGPLSNNYYPDGIRVSFTPVTVLYLSYYF